MLCSVFKLSFASACNFHNFVRKSFRGDSCIEIKFAIILKIFSFLSVLCRCPAGGSQ